MTRRQWITEARRLAPFIAHVAVFDPSDAFDAAARSIITRLESQALAPTVKGAARLVAGQEACTAGPPDRAHRLDALAAAAGGVRPEVVRHTDVRPDEANLPLSLARADVVREASQKPAAPPGPRHDGHGSGQPVAESDETDKRRTAARPSASAARNARNFGS